MQQAGRGRRFAVIAGNVERALGRCRLLRRPRWYHFGIFANCSWQQFLAERTSATQVPGPMGSALPGTVLLLALTSLALAAVALTFRERQRELLPPSRVDVALAALGVVGTIVIVGTPSAPVPSSGPIGVPHAAMVGATALGYALAGIGSAWSLARWGTAYGQAGIYDMVGMQFVASMASPVVKSALHVAPQTLAIVLGATLPAMSIYAAARVSRQAASPFDQSRVLYGRGSYGHLASVAACIVVYSLTDGTVFASLDQASRAMGAGSYLAARALDLLTSASILAWVFALNRGFDFLWLWRWVFVLLAATLMAVTVAPEEGVAATFALSALTSTEVFLWAVLSDVSQHCSVHPATIFSLGWLSYCVPYGVGLTLAPTLSGRISGGTTALVLMFTLALTITFCLGTNETDSRRIFADLRPRTAAPQEYAMIDERCAALARDRNLTERETDVLKQLSRGRSRSYIAEALSLSENTVKSYTRHLYVKLGIHSRQELLGMLGME